MAELIRPADMGELEQAQRLFRARCPVKHSSLYWLPDALAEALRAGRLLLCAGDTALLLLRDEGTHYACALEAAERFGWPLPAMEKPVVCEVIYTARRPLPDSLRQSLDAAGLTVLRTTLRFTSPLQAPVEPAPEVRPAREEDLPALRALLADCFDPRLDFVPDEAELARALSQGDLLALPRDGVPVGFAYATVARNRGVLRHIAVARPYRGQGLSRPLMRAALARFATGGAKTAELWSGSENHAAHHLYEQFGFAPDGRMADEYTI